ncbi:hypothetical protein [uncultured Agrobacterium sp.]|uniref:hypothetical protein n=1 Tax=uncultured Agrobacterium sp. TaxID=157277 RepID=UPI0025ED55D7|nr:hypothetical protein [uncultured Agrobacterium sp.]
MIDEWKREVGARLEQLVDSLVANGVSYEDACSMIVVQVNALMVAREHDQDPADYESRR